jgi:hypothetical protein
MAKNAARSFATSNALAEMMPLRPFDAAAYALPHGNLVIMDGYHRFAALAIAGRSFDVHAWIVEGPLDSSILPDLTYWERRSREI